MLYTSGMRGGYGVGNLLQTTLELTVGLFALLILTKVMGKTSFAQITPFDFISALILGELVGNAIYDNETKLGTILYSVLIWGVLLFIIEWSTQRFRKTRKFFLKETRLSLFKTDT